MSGRTCDVVVIGAGPAGLAAASVVAEAGLTCIAVDRMGPGGQLMNLGRLHGVPDIDPDTTGPDLLATLCDRALSAGVELAIDEVTAIEADGALVVVGLEERITAKTVVMATGLRAGSTGLASEATYDGAGLSHCANCDGPLYAGKNVAVVGDDVWSITEALELADHAARVTLVTGAGLSGPADRRAALEANDRIEVVEGAVVALEGTGQLAAIVVELTTGARRCIPAAGLFVYRARRPALDLLPVPLHDAAVRGLHVTGDAGAVGETSLARAIADGEATGQDVIAWLKARTGM
jgi:thioredoxin reductase (NADPH)